MGGLLLTGGALVNEPVPIDRAEGFVGSPEQIDLRGWLFPVSWGGSGYVRARFGGMPLLVTPEVAAQIKAFREEHL